MADLIRRSDVIGLLEDMLLFGEYDIIASSFSKADEEKVYRAINDIPAVNRCIPCSERMPEIRTPVLIYDKHHKAFFVAKLDEDYFGFSSNMWHHPADVPFWMPLPETPKEDDND